MFLELAVREYLKRSALKAWLNAAPKNAECCKLKVLNNEKPGLRVDLSVFHGDLHAFRADSVLFDFSVCLLPFPKQSVRAQVFVYGPVLLLNLFPIGLGAFRDDADRRRDVYESEIAVCRLDDFNIVCTDRVCLSVVIAYDRAVVDCFEAALKSLL